VRKTQEQPEFVSSERQYRVQSALVILSLGIRGFDHLLNGILEKKKMQITRELTQL
jgi:hypothetical protein